MYVFAVSLKDAPGMYPPHGIRIAVYANLAELAIGVGDYMGEMADAKASEALYWHLLNSRWQQAKGIIDDALCCPWSIYSTQINYVCG